MECPNCTFQNTPGTRSCVRCRSLVDFSGVEVLPPRAADGRLRRRVRGAAAVMRFGLRDRVASLRRSARVSTLEQVVWSELAWTLIPGLGHLRRGDCVFGWLLLGSWTTLLLLSALSFGTSLALPLGFAALSVHCLAFSLLLSGPMHKVGIAGRLMLGLGIYGALLLGLYHPAYSMVAHMVRVIPVQGVRTKTPFTNGDVLLYTGEWTRPDAWQRGDLVVFEIRNTRQANTIIQSGFGVDRIVGLPGDHVRVEGRTLFVNDEEQPEETSPVLGTAGLPPMSLVAAEGEYIVLPTSLRWRTHGQAQPLVQSMIETVGRVPESRLLGKVLWRVRPWSRFGPVDDEGTGL